MTTLAQLRKDFPHMNPNGWYLADRAARDRALEKPYQIGDQSAEYSAWYLAKHGHDYAAPETLTDKANLAFPTNGRFMFADVPVNSDAFAAMLGKLYKHKLAVTVEAVDGQGRASGWAM